MKIVALCVTTLTICGTFVWAESKSIETRKPAQAGTFVCLETNGGSQQLLNGFKQACNTSLPFSFSYKPDKIDPLKWIVFCCTSK